jgi:hypothetical protein
MSFTGSSQGTFVRWRAICLILSLGVVSWLIGRAAFLAARALMPPPQMEAVAFWSAVASLLLLPVAVTPVLLEGSRYRPTARSAAPILLAVLGFVPVTVIGGIWGSGGSDLSSSPIALTCLMGLVLAAFAAGYAAQSRVH